MPGTTKSASVYVSTFNNIVSIIQVRTIITDDVKTFAFFLTRGYSQ